MKEQPLQERKIYRSVGRRLTALIIFMIVTLSVAMMFIGHVRFKESTENYYHRIGEATAGIVALSVDADSLDKYMKTRTKDKEFDKTMMVLRKAAEICKAKVLYVFQVNEAGIHYIYDTEIPDTQNELGEFDPFVQIDPDTGKVGRLYPEETEKQLRDGGKVDTVMSMERYGWIINVNEPLYGRDGRIKGYVGLDFDVNDVVAERTVYLWQLAAIMLVLTAIFAVLYLYIIRKAIIHPINTMAKAADCFLVNNLRNGKPMEESDILSMEINTRDEMQSLADSLKSMVLKIQEYITNLNLATIKSETDVLTTLCNRGAFEQRVSALLCLRSEKEPLIDCFMMIDVDYFKAVNDTYGHAAGDKVLSECSQALLKVTRAADVVGRLGGDEFAVFCKNISSVAIAEDKARQIREEWLKIIPPGSEKGVTASIGISFAPQDGQRYQDLFAKADEALYKAKDAGRDGFTISHAHKIKDLPALAAGNFALSKAGNI
jgi:diguanylate cyclase (GGDEF)-like protein